MMVLADLLPMSSRGREASGEARSRRLVGRSGLFAAFAVVALALSTGSRVEAQDSTASPPSLVMVQQSSFSRWKSDTMTPTATLRPSLTDGAPAAPFWASGLGATVGASSALFAAQGFCGSDNACIGESVGAAFVGSVLGGAIEGGMKY